MVQVAFFAPLLTTGGTQRHLQQVVRQLDRRRFTARVFTLRPGGEVAAALDAAGVAVSSLDIGARLTTPRAIVAMLRAARALRRAGVQIVHGYQWRPALVGAITARLARVPLVLASKRSLTGDDRAARIAWRVIARRVDTIIANAAALRAEAEALGVAARWEIIPNGVEVDHFRAALPPATAKAALGLDPGRPVIGTIGRLESRKGHEDLLLAAQRLMAAGVAPAPQLLIVGDGPLRGALAARAVALGLGANVVFTGTIPDVRSALGAMDLFVLASRAEGLSNALLEAMAAGRPVIATAVGGMSEAFDGDRTGVLVPPGDPAALAAAIGSLLEDPARGARLGAAAQGWVAERFSAPTMAARLERLYTERLAARQARWAA